MAKRILETGTVYTGHLHTDVLPLTFANLDPTDLLIAERVCKTWRDVSISHNELWDFVAYRKGIFVDRSTPIRVQVIQSFGPYCIAARMIFSKELKHIPKDLNPIMEKRMIDQAIFEMDKSLLDPLTALLKHLSVDGIPIYPIDKGIVLISDCIKMMPAWVETGKLTLNEELYHHLMEQDGYLKNFHLDLTSLLDKLKNGIMSLLTEDRRQYYFTFPKVMQNIQNINNAISSLAEYILHFTDKPSLEIVSDLYLSSATLQLRAAWHKIGTVYFANRNILNPLLENLKDTDWENTFEKFMLENNTPVNIEIDYPSFLKKILQNMDTTDLQQLINLIPTPKFKSDHPCIIYMHKQIQKDIVRSLLRFKT